MAYMSRNLSVLAYANGFTLWHYTTDDKVVDTEGYFNAAANMLRVGDIIITNMDTAGTPVGGLFFVVSNSSTEVVVNDLTRISPPDTE
jgi:hypothetical protein